MLMVICLLLTALSGCVSADGGYEVQVVDSQGAPVQGVMVQFCSDTQCMMSETNEDGVAAYDVPAGSYTVHLLKVPKGYELDSREFSAPESPRRMTLMLNRIGEP